MKPVVLYRIAAVWLAIFAILHTIGFLRFKPPTEEGMAVLHGMESVQFVVNGTNFSYGHFYEGFGLFITAYLLFSAVLAWQLGSLAAARVQAVRPIGWSLCAVQIASIALGWYYFSPVQGVFAGVSAALLGWAAWLI